jgi:type VI secretion system protein ImpA
MPETTPNQARIAGWLLPLDGADGPAGKDFEYDNDFLQLVKAAEGVPETQFSSTEPPNWRNVRELAETLLERSRDLRVAVLWIRSRVNLDGFLALADGIALLQGLLDGLWDHVHPLPDPDDGDTYARANALAPLPLADGLLGDLRQSTLFTLRGIGELRLRTVEVALGLIAAKDGENTLSRDQLTEMLAAALEQLPQLRRQLQNTLAELEALSARMNERLGIVNAPDTRAIQALIKNVLGLLPEPLEEVPAEDPEAGDGSAASTLFGARGTLLGRVQSRADALRAIEMVCDYLDRSEPGNPAQLLLRRASRLINQNFLQLMKELAPDALNEVARLMGVDPDSVTLEK